VLSKNKPDRGKKRDRPKREEHEGSFPKGPKVPNKKDGREIDCRKRRGLEPGEESAGQQTCFNQGAKLTRESIRQAKTWAGNQGRQN